MKTTYLGLYRDAGLGGSYSGFAIRHPFLIFCAVAEIILGLLSVMLSKFAMDIANQDMSRAIIIVAGAIFLSKSDWLLYMLKKRKNAVTLEIQHRIFKHISQNLKQGSYKFFEEHPFVDVFEGLCRFIWAYVDTTDNFIRLFCQICNSVSAILMITWSNTFLMICMVPAYYVMYLFGKYIYNKGKNEREKEKKENGDDSRELGWQRFFYDHFATDQNMLNPSFENHQIPDVSSAMKDIIKITLDRSFRRESEKMVFNLGQSVLEFMIAMGFILVNQSQSVVLLLLNSHRLFGVLTALFDLKKSDDSAETNVKKIFDMLDSINNGNMSEVRIMNHQLTFGRYSHLRIANFCYDVINKKGEVKLQLRLNEVRIPLVRGYILLHGPSGCGKSIMAKLLSGNYDNNICDLSGIISGSNDHEPIRSEFRDLVHNRNYMEQEAAEKLKYNGKIRCSLDKLFPRATLQEIKNLMKGFGMEDMVPETLTASFDCGISGGEIQRVALASYIWKMLHGNPMYIILDEPEKAIDPEMAMNILDYIHSKFHVPIFIITHSPDIKKHIEQDLIQVWRYNKTKENKVVKIDIKNMHDIYAKVDLDEFKEKN